MTTAIMSIASLTATNLEPLLHKAIREKTKGSIRGLVISTEASQVTVCGRTSSYYIAQLALVATQQVLNGAMNGCAVRMKVVVEP